MKLFHAPTIAIVLAAALAACSPNGLSAPSDRPSLKDSQDVGTPERFRRLNPGRNKG